jgi:hypothetical protein
MAIKKIAGVKMRVLDFIDEFINSFSLNFNKLFDKIAIGLSRVRHLDFSLFEIFSVKQ